MNFDKSTIKLHYFSILSILAKFQGNQRLITMSLINCLISSIDNVTWAKALGLMVSRVEGTA